MSRPTQRGDRRDVKPGGSVPSLSRSPGSPPQSLRRARAGVCAPRPAPGGRERGGGSGEGGVAPGCAGGAVPDSCPAHQPRPPGCGGGGGGSGRGDSAGGEELGTGSGRHRHLRGRHQGRAAPRCQPCLPGLRAVCAASPAAAPGRDAGAGRAAGTRRGGGPWLPAPPRDLAQSTAPPQASVSRSG